MTYQKNNLDLNLPPNSSKSDVINLSIICFIWIAMVIIANPIGNFPLNDDWVYGLAVKSVLETGYYQFPSPSSANVGPQVYWGALFCLPFGFSFTALRFSSLTLGLIGVLTLYQLIRKFDVDSKPALLGALVLAVNPLYFGLANSFMTDVPFVVVVLISLFFMVRGFQRDSGVDIIVGLGISFAAILIRQLGLVILIAFAFAYPVKYGITTKNLVKVFLLILTGAMLHVLYQYWLVHSGRTPLLMLHSDVSKLSPSSFGKWIWAMCKTVVNTVIYIGFFIAPFVILFVRCSPTGFRSSHLKNLRLILVTAALILLGIIFWTNNALPSLPNVLIKSGLGPLLLRDTYFLNINYPTIPQFLLAVWDGITVLAAMTAFAGIYFLVITASQSFIEVKRSKSHSETWVFWLFFIMMITYFLVLIVIASSVTIFDRYLLIFIPLIIVLISNVKFENPLRMAWTVVPSILLIAIYFLYSAISTHDYLSWNRTRWIALHDLINRNGLHPNQIDGGYEFNGWFLYDAKYKNSIDKSWWWVASDEYIVTSGPIFGYSEVQRYFFRRWLLLSDSNILVLRKNSNSK